MQHPPGIIEERLGSLIIDGQRCENCLGTGQVEEPVGGG